MALQHLREKVFRLLVLLFYLSFEHEEGDGVLLVLFNDAADALVTLALLKLAKRWLDAARAWSFRLGRFPILVLLSCRVWSASFA